MQHNHSNAKPHDHVFGIWLCCIHLSPILSTDNGKKQGPFRVGLKRPSFKETTSHSQNSRNVKRMYRPPRMLRFSQKEICLPASCEHIRAGILTQCQCEIWDSYCMLCCDTYLERSNRFYACNMSNKRCSRDCPFPISKVAKVSCSFEFDDVPRMQSHGILGRSLEGNTSEFKLKSLFG